MSTPIKTLQYLNGFHCLGPDCPDSCCVGWKVTIDEASYRKLQKRMKKASAAEVKLFRDGMRRQRSNPSAGQFAKTRLDADGRCSFLDGQGLCQIQARYGEDCLSETCAFYPRVFSKSAGELRMGATLSCPETARLCLLQADATETVGLDPALLPRLPRYLRDYDARAGKGGAEYAGPVAGVFAQFLGLADYPLSSRLFFVSRLADLLTTALAQEDQGAGVVQSIESMADPALLNDLDVQFSQLDVDPRVAIAMLQSFLHARVHDSAGGRLKALLTEVVGVYAQRLGAPLENWGLETDQNAARMAADYVVFRDYWRTHFAARLDLYRLNFCRNYLLFRGIPDYPSPLVYVIQMLVSSLLSRFLLFSHPRLVAAMEADLAVQDPAAAAQLLDATVVDVVQRLFRDLEHNPRTATMIDTVLRERELLNLPYAAYLIAV